MHILNLIVFIYLLLVQNAFAAEPQNDCLDEPFIRCLEIVKPKSPNYITKEEDKAKYASSICNSSPSTSSNTILKEKLIETTTAGEFGVQSNKVVEKYGEELRTRYYQCRNIATDQSKEALQSAILELLRGDIQTVLAKLIPGAKINIELPTPPNPEQPAEKKSSN